jgi:hypothetical protein
MHRRPAADSFGRVRDELDETSSTGYRARGLGAKGWPGYRRSIVIGVGATMEIERKRITAVRTLEVLGYSYCNGEWLAPAAANGTPLSMAAEAHAMHGNLEQPMDALAGCMEGSAEASELKAIVDLIEACEAKWGPMGKDPNVPRGKA